MRSYKLSSDVRLGSKVKEDYAPGAFMTADVLKNAMLEQKRAMIGGHRIYGSEYDGYYQNRRWDLPGGAKPPSLGQTEVVSQYLTPEDLINAGVIVPGCATPGLKIRSRGAGRGLARGRGRGPMGVPAGTISGLGAEEKKELPEPEDVDLMTAIREIYGTTVSIKPLAEFVGAHPVGTVAFLMMAIGIWAGIASFIGAGGADALRQSFKK